jgi:hypothetical protein
MRKGRETLDLPDEDLDVPEYTPGEPVLFLDIDGVLNKHNFDELAGSNLIDQALVQIFNRILLTTGCKIVLSTAWRYIYYQGEANLIGLDWLFRSHGVVGRRIIDVTGQDTMVPYYNGTTLKEFPVKNERGAQIQQWLDLNDPDHLSPYVVIDDGGYSDDKWTDLGITESGHPVVWTLPTTGITHANADDAIAILDGETRDRPSPLLGRYRHKEMHFVPHEVDGARL